MTRFFVTLLAASFALTAVAAVAENAASDSRNRLTAAWEQAEAADADQRRASSGPVATASRTNVTGIGERRHKHLSGPWAGNFAGGRKHAPAGH